MEAIGYTYEKWEIRGGLKRCLAIEKKLQKEIIFVSQGIPKGGVDAQIVNSFYDRVFLD